MSDDGWQPVETAPKDGTAILAYGEVLDEDGVSVEPEVAVVRWRRGQPTGWFDWEMPGDARAMPICWRPLPSPPGSSE